MTYIDISKKDLDIYIQKNGIENTIKNIINIIRNEKLGFPYKKYFIESSKNLFTNLKNYNILIIYNRPYKLKNIINQTGRFFNIFHIKYNNKYIYIPNNPNNYDEINVIADHFTEDARIKSIGYMEKISPYDCWNNDDCIKKIIKYSIINFGYINVKSLRESIYKTITEARQGTPTSYLVLYNFFNAKHILDGASAWGDRLISALAYKKTRTYIGVDPNFDLFIGYEKILKKFMKIKNIYIANSEKKYNIIEEMNKKGITNSIYKIVDNNVTRKLETFSTKSSKKIILLNSPFEKLNLPDIYKFDLCILSPAPFEGEIYGNSNEQSIINYRKLDEWFVNYMLFSVYIMYKKLKLNGHLIITILDRPNENYKIVELLNLSINYICKKLTYEGVIGWEGSKQKITPWFVWKKKKIADNILDDKMNQAKKLLMQYYPHFFNEINKKFK